MSDAAGHATRNGRLAMILAAIAWSSAGVLQRELTATPATQVFGRALFAFLSLLILVLLTDRKGIVSSLRSLGWTGVAVIAALALSSGTFLLALNYTTVANVLFLMATAPVFAALLGWAVLGERIAPRTWLAMGLAAGGVSAMVAGTLEAGFLAVALPLVMTAAFALVIVLTRLRRDVSMLPATCVSQAVVALVWLPFISLGSATGEDWSLFFVLGTFQVGAGLALLTIAARLLPAAEVAVLSLLEIVIGPIWVWLAYSERPNTATFIGGVVVAAAVVVQATGSRPTTPAPDRQPVAAAETG
jgi:drug/metabolite transporter (DMT)-like permease